MPPAIIGGVIAGAGAVGAAAIGSKAAKKAAKTQAQATDQSVALQRDIYEQNRGALSPFMARGNAAGEAISAFLGLGGANGTAVTPSQSALDAYNVFKQSTGYQDRLAEGYRGINAGYAGRGLVQSGAAQKALLRYGQQQASGEFGNYLGYLGNQQGVGLSAASALAGVGQGYANNVGALNSANAQVQGQAAIAGANNTIGAISGIGSAFANAFGQSSYGGYGGGVPRFTPPPYTLPTGVTVALPPVQATF